MAKGPVLIEQTKLLRVLKLIIFLSKRRHTIEEIAVKLELSERTAYRYLNLLDSVGILVEQDFSKRWFIVPHMCPLCQKKEVHHG